MMRIVGLACGIALLAPDSLLPSAAQEARSQSAPVTLTATIAAIDNATRTITLTGAGGTPVQVQAPDEMEGFNALRVGDVVTATYFEALAVSVRKPGSPAPPAPTDTTMTQRKDRAPGSETRRQVSFTVTIEAIDQKAPSLTVKGPQGRVVTLSVRDATQLQNLKAGDSVDVTYYESLLVKVARPR
jgi:hypothetical protein